MSKAGLTRNSGLALPTVNLTSVRFQKNFTITEHNKIEANFDLFNIFNSNTILGVENVSTTTRDRKGNTVARFGRAQSILNPRIFRLGVRYVF